MRTPAYTTDADEERAAARDAFERATTARLFGPCLAARNAAADAVGSCFVPADEIDRIQAMFTAASDDLVACMREWDATH